MLFWKIRQLGTQIALLEKIRAQISSNKHSHLDLEKFLRLAVHLRLDRRVNAIS